MLPNRIHPPNSAAEGNSMVVPSQQRAGVGTLELEMAGACMAALGPGNGSVPAHVGYVRDGDSVPDGVPIMASAPTHCEFSQ